MLAFASCAKTTDDAGFGTNTNWLKRCAESGDCDGAAQRICGQCTLTCAETADCGAAHAEASCEQGLCRAVLRAETECFGPEGNVEQADTPGAIGCGCYPLRLRSCAGSVTLECIAEQHGLAWDARR